MPPDKPKGGAPLHLAHRPNDSAASPTATITTPIIAHGRIVRARSGSWLLVVDRCPFCRRKHTHGAPAGPEMREERRVSHCAGTARPYRVIVSGGAA